MGLVLGSQAQTACTAAAAGVSPWHVLTDQTPRLSSPELPAPMTGRRPSPRWRAGLALVPEGKGCSGGAGAGAEAASGGKRPSPRCRSCGHTRPDQRANPVGTEPQPSPADYGGWLMCLMRFTIFYTRPMMLLNWTLMNWRAKK